MSNATPKPLLTHPKMNELKHAVNRIRQWSVSQIIFSPHGIVFAVGVASLWFAFGQKMQRIGSEIPGVAAQTAVGAAFSILALVALIYLLAKKKITGSLSLLLLLWGWIFLRDLANGDAVLAIILGSGIVILSVYAATLTKKNLSLVHLTFPTGFLAAGLIITLINPANAFRADGTSDFLGQLPLGQYIGFAGHPNHLGPVMAVGLLIIFAQKKLNPLLSVLAALFLMALVASGSDGSIGAFAIAMFFLAISHDRAHLTPGAAPWRTIVSTVAAIFIGVWTIILITRTGFSTFSTGRTTIWSSYLEPALAAGFFGFGHFPDRVANPVFDDVTLLHVDPHNMWLTTQVTGGLVASVIHLVFWVAVIRAISKLPKSPDKTLAIGIAAFLVTYGTVESLLFTGFRVYYPAFGLLLGLLITRQKSPFGTSS